MENQSFGFAQKLRDTLYYRLPYPLLKFAYSIGVKVLFAKQYKAIVSYLESENDLQKQELLSDIKKSGKLQAIYGKWTEKYNGMPNSISKDKDGNLYANHVCVDGIKRLLYLPENMGKAAARVYYETLLLEQDEQSPHCYFTEEFRKWFQTTPVGTILDLGAAEGLISLECVGNSDKVILFEGDEKWFIPLEKTFENYKDKVKIVKRFVSDSSDKDYISIDEYFGDNIPNDIKLIKMDIEGFEQRALAGMKKTIEKNPNVVLLICAYHTQNADEEIKSIMGQMGFEGIGREGYIFFWIDKDFKEPYARKGVIEYRKKR